ncbi:innexin shaking-B-like [Pollicipes pollicipes]|uniref:innexin shaking-B-like n=1 Tax=Pollicipes pollicipes TaxID=41117 RepID=UPI001884B761|nr:innexin shaking-B-like [Pollicipes pollicipes]
MGYAQVLSEQEERDRREESQEPEDNTDDATYSSTEPDSPTLPTLKPACNSHWSVVCVDPLIRVFPRMTKCIFRKYGASSNIEVLDVLCILPLNIVNEKLYLFLWFWFLILAGLTMLNTMMRLLLMISPRLRAFFLQVRLRFVSRDAISVIIRRSRIGDWFLLYMLGQNMDPVIFSEVMSDLARRLGHKGKDYSEA